jgi:uncharacterized protein (TIGR02145 family)
MIMKQTKKIKILLVAALGGLSVMGYAQGKVCEGSTYEIQELQAPSDPSVYKWLEDGNEIPGAAAAGYTVPSGKAVGKYTYVRRSKKEGCDWASSNAYTVEVITCTTLDNESVIGATGSFVDPRDNKAYKTVKMPDGKIWFAENLNYQTGLIFNQRTDQAKGVNYLNATDGVPAIGSYWCPGTSGTTLSADRNTCNMHGALYSWETAMSENGVGTWEETAVSGNYFTMGPIGSTPQADINNAKGLTNAGICPSGWHVPTLKEWALMLDKVEGDGNGTIYADAISNWYGSDAAVKLAEASATLNPEPGQWLLTVNIPTNETKFSAVQGGIENFAFIGRSMADHWSSSVVQSDRAAWLHMNLGYSGGICIVKIGRMNAGYVRCRMD